MGPFSQIRAPAGYYPAMRRVVLLLGLLSVCGHALSADDKEWKEHPIAKVVTLLQDMQGSLEEEAKKDQELYDTLVCWCETNEKEKTKSIADGKQSIKELTASVEENTALASQIKSDLQNLESEIAKNKKALEEATAVREKELAEFNANEKDAIASIASLKSALVTLGKHNEGAAMVQRAALVQLTQTLRRHLKQQPQTVSEAVPPHQRRLLLSLLQQPQGMETLLQQTAQASGPGASGEIFGMLSQMKETFETNSETAKKEEAEAAQAYVELKASKSQEIKAGEDKAFEKTEGNAKTLETAATSAQDLKDTEASVEADSEFLGNLQKTCAGIDKQFEERSKTRSEEIAAVSETLSFLTSDEAHELLSKSLGFLQLRAEAQRNAVQREKARQFLEDAGSKLNSKRISYLATRMRFDPFGQMRESIDGMIYGLGKEKDGEIIHKDECVDDLNTNEKDTTAKTTHKEEVEHEIADLEADIDAKTEEEKMLEHEIYEAKYELQKASENREAENKDFQVTIKDQRATQKILEMAVSRLKEFYDKKASASLLQQRAQLFSDKQAPPVEFGAYKKSTGGGAVALIQSIIDESKAVETDAIKGETDSQEAYEGFVKDTNKEINMKQRVIVGDEEAIAFDTTEKATDDNDRKGTGTDILKLGDIAKTLHTDCDFTLTNFDNNQKKRDSEVEALKQSKSIFSGAGFGR